MSLTRLAGLGVMLCLAPVPAAAQAVSGRVLMPDSVTPAAGLVVTATTAAGATAGRALTTSAGNYVIPLKAAGAYDVRVLRIGFRPTVVRVTIAAGQTATQDIIVASLPVAIEGMRVADDDDCTLKGKNGLTFLALLDQARAALGAASLWEQSGSLRVEMVRVEGRIDATYGNRSDSLYAEVDTATATQVVVSRAFGATPPETLNTAGYMRARGGDRYLYDLPNAEVLLSDDFVGTHCFSIRRDDDRPQWIGLGFKPRKRVRDFVDVKGTLWLDQASAELRRLEFTYDNTPETKFELCDKSPFIKITPDLLHEVPAFTQPAPSCWTMSNSRDNRLELGGSADFVRLPSGEWLVASWFLRTAPDEGRFRRAYRKHRYDRATKKMVVCFHGPDCRELVLRHARLVTVAGRTTRVTRDVYELYRDDTAQPLIDAIRRRSGRSER